MIVRSACMHLWTHVCANTQGGDLTGMCVRVRVCVCADAHVQLKMTQNLLAIKEADLQAANELLVDVGMESVGGAGTFEGGGGAGTRGGVGGGASGGGKSRVKLGAGAPGSAGGGSSAAMAAKLTSLETENAKLKQDNADAGRTASELQRLKTQIKNMEREAETQRQEMVTQQRNMAKQKHSSEQKSQELVSKLRLQLKESQQALINSQTQLKVTEKYVWQMKEQFRRESEDNNERMRR